MTTLETQIAGLSKSQLEIFNSLVRLGDSKELALKTVLATKEHSTDLYQSAYCN